jgi:HPt (histidine-containing phosphotransfer) domain-containing protein
MPASSASRPPDTPRVTDSELAEPALSELPILDTRPLNDLLDLGGSSDLVHELIALFQEDVPVRLAILKTALEAADAPQAMMEAHQLKGSLSNMGLVRFADLVSRIESQAREGWIEKVPGIAEVFSASYEEALHALNTAYPQD